MNIRDLSFALALSLFVSALSMNGTALANPPVGSSPAKGGASKSMRPASLVTLSKADRFYGPTPGETGMSAVQKAYAEASGSAGQLETDDLNWLLKSGTPAGRIYAAVLLWQTGRIGPNLSYDLLAKDSATVEFQDGCKVIGTTVKEVAQSLKEQNRFMNFQVGSMFCKLVAKSPAATPAPKSSEQSQVTPEEKAVYPDIEKALAMRNVPPGVHVAPFPRPACFIKLKQATTLDNGAVGEGATESLNWRAFVNAKVITRKLPYEAEDLLKNGTPAGKIYGAILLYETTDGGHAATFEKLKSDNAAVSYRSGCEIEKTTVANIAKSFIQTNAYADFKLKANSDSNSSSPKPKSSTPKHKSYGSPAYGRTFGAGQSETLVCPGCLHVMRDRKNRL